MTWQNQTMNKCLVNIQFSKEVTSLRITVFYYWKNISTIYFCYLQHNSYRHCTLLSLICISKIFSIPHLNVDEGSANIFCRGQGSKCFWPCGSCGLCCNHSTLPLLCESGYGQYVNKWAELYSNQTLFTKQKVTGQQDLWVVCFYAHHTNEEPKPL